MSKVTRNLAIVLALGFLLAGVAVLMRTLTGERVESYVFPCALIGGGLFTGVLAWNFGSDVGVTGMCTSEDDGGGDGVEASGSDNAA